jgi:bifunctional DNase/RNase
MHSSTYTLFLLGDHTKEFAIFTSPHTGTYIQMEQANQIPPRPLTHTILDSIFKELGIKPLQVVISDVEDTVYYARLFLEQMIEGQRRILEIDARPSDALVIALKNDLPLFCTKEVFEKTFSI